MSSITQIENEFLSASISSMGAELQSLKTGDGLWQGLPEFWTGRAPILFPIVGKAPGDELVIDGERYPIKQHGFARRSEFELQAAKPDWCQFELKASASTRAAYPFEFFLNVVHVLEGPKYSISLTVGNPGDVDLPFSIGGHPAFVWPLPGAEAGAAHAIELANGAEPDLLRLRDGLLDTSPLPSPFDMGRLVLDHSLFEADAMIFPEGAGEALTYRAEGGPTLRFTSTNLPNLALWTKPGAPFICIEPWRGMAAEVGSSGDIKERPWSTFLPPGAQTSFAYSVEFDV